MGTNIQKIGTHEIQNELQNYETHTTESHSRMLAGDGIAKLKFIPCSRDLPEKIISPQLVCQLILHYHIHNSPAPVPILGQINPVHTHHSTPRRSTVILSPIYPSVFQVISFTQDCPSNPCTHLSYLPLCST